MTILGRTFTQADARRVLWTAAQAAIGVFTATSIASVSDAKRAALTAGSAAIAAAISALKNWFLSDESPVK